jgi:hypothetical protein
VRLHNNKICVEADWLEEGIVKRLLERGMPKEDIVLAFHHPEVRTLTDFAMS